MTTDNNDIKQYTSEDIARYWQGKMSAQEMHALEKAAMDDPFLADALEGYSSADPQTISSDVEELRQRLRERTDDTKVVPLRRNRWWRIAAALILLCGVGGLAYLLLQQNTTSPNVAQKETATVQKTDSPATVRQPELSANDERNMVQQQDSNSNDYKAIATVPSESENIKPFAKSRSDIRDDKTTDNDPIQSLAKSETKTAVPSPAGMEALKDNLRKDSILTAQSDASRVGNVLEGRAAGINVQSRNQTPNMPVDQNSRMFINNFFGRVVDQNNNAIPHASVRVNNNNQVAATNNDGMFQIRSADTALDISIASVGYQSRQLNLRANQPQDVVLEPHSGKMQEVVVTAHASKRKKEVTGSSSYVMEAQPVGGWEQYNNYLQTSKRIDSADNTIKGEVVVAFQVAKNGKLSDITIEKSLGKVQDAEAIRLVRQGPPWKLSRGKRAKARVVVAF